jgi:hypothetical protein
MKKGDFLKLVDEIISEIQKEDDDLDEITVTGNVDGYNTPNAFKKTDGNNPDDEPDDEYVKRINTGTGFTKVNEGKDWKQFLDPYNWFKSKNTFQIRIKNVEPSVVEKLIKFTKKRGDIVDRSGSNAWGITKESLKDNQSVWQYLDGHLYYKNPYHKSIYDTFIPKLVKSKNEVNEKLSENRWHQLRKEDATPNKKIGVGIRNIRKQLSEIELFLNWYSKLKTENGLTKETYWRRTNRHLNAIKERLNNISDRISNL